MKKEVSPVTAAIVIIVVVAIIAIVGWWYFAKGTEAPAIDPSKMPIGGPGVPPSGLMRGGMQPGARLVNRACLPHLSVRQHQEVTNAL